MYKVFTPFKNAFIRRLRDGLPACVAAPKPRQAPARQAPPLPELNYPQTPFDGLLFAADEKRRWRVCARFVSKRRRITRGSATSRPWKGPVACRPAAIGVLSPASACIVC